MSEMLQGTSVVRPGERIATLLLSVRAHTPQDPFQQAIRLMYAEVIQSGAGKLNKDAWQDALGDLGSFIRVSIDDGDIDLAVRSVDTSLKKTLALVAMLFSEPRFDIDEVECTRRNLINRLELAKEDARAASDQMFSEAIFSRKDRRSAYSIPSLIKEVAKVTVQDLRTLHTSLWSYPWIYTSGGGSESVATIDASVSAIWKKGVKLVVEAPVYVPPPLRPLPEKRVLLRDIPNKQNIEFSMGAPLPLTRTDDTYPAFVFGMNVLGIPGGFTGRLMSTVREKEGLTYGIYGRVEEVTVMEQGVWRISTFFSPKDALKGLASTIREVHAMHTKGITEDELRRFKVILGTRYALINDSLLKQVAESHGLKKVGVTSAAYEEYKHRMQSMTVREVNNAMDLFLDPRNIVISGAGPIAGVRKELEAFTV